MPRPWLCCLLFPLVALLLRPAPGVQAASCTYVLGFAELHALIPNIVGDCLEDEQHNPANGDALQHSTAGLLVWRKADNFTAFTDGYHSWVNGPYGVQERLNSQRFDWEANPDGLPVVRGGTASAASPAPVSAVRWQITVSRATTETSVVRTDALGHQDTLQAAGVYVTVSFSLHNSAQAPAFLSSADFTLTDSQGRAYLASFQLQQVQPDGSGQEFDGTNIDPGASVNLWLTFDIFPDATGLVLAAPGSNRAAVPSPVAAA